MIGSLAALAYMAGKPLTETSKGSYSFANANDDAAFKKLIGSKTPTAGQYFGDYAVVGNGPDTTPPDYEEVGRYSGDTKKYLAGGSDVIAPATRIVKRKAPAAPPEVKPPAIEAKPAPSFDAASWSKPSAPAAERPRYQLNTEASGYQKWLAENRPGTGSDSSQPDTPSTGGGGGGDRVRFFQDKLAAGEPGAAVAGRYSDAVAANAGGERRMAGGRQFRERLSRYR